MFDLKLQQLLHGARAQVISAGFFLGDEAVTFSDALLDPFALCVRHGSGHLADGFEAGRHAVAAQGQAALALIAGLDRHALHAETVNVDGDELGGALHHLAEGDGVGIADPEHFVGVADLEVCGGHVSLAVLN